MAVLEGEAPRATPRLNGRRRVSVAALAARQTARVWPGVDSVGHARARHMQNPGAHTCTQTQVVPRRQLIGDQFLSMTSASATATQRSRGHQNMSCMSLMHAIHVWIRSMRCCIARARLPRPRHGAAPNPHTHAPPRAMSAAPCWNPDEHRSRRRLDTRRRPASST